MIKKQLFPLFLICFLLPFYTVKSPIFASCIPDDDDLTGCTAIVGAFGGGSQDPKHTFYLSC